MSGAEKAARISDSFGRFAQGIYWRKTPRAVGDDSGLSRGLSPVCLERRGPKTLLKTENPDRVFTKLIQIL